MVAFFVPLRYTTPAVRPARKHGIIDPVIDWNAAKLRRFWPPVLGLQLLVVAALILGAALELSVDSSSPDRGTARAPLGSLDYAVEGIGFVLFLAQFIVIFVMPATGSAMATTLALALATFPSAAEYPAVWVLIAAVAGVVTGWFLLAQLRPLDAQNRVPRCEVPFDECIARRSPIWGFIALSLVAVAAITLIIFHSIEVRDVRDFEARAEVVTSPVEEVVDETELVVVIGEVEHLLDAVWLEEIPQVGDQVDVLVDPQDPTRAVLRDAPDDPSWLLGLAALTPLAAWFVLWRWLVPVWRRRRLAADGGPVGRARLVDVDEDHMFLIPSDDAWPALRVTRLDVLGQLEDPDGSFGIDEEAAGDDAEDDAADEEDEQMPSTPEELSAFLDEICAEEEDDPVFDKDHARLFGPDASTPLPVTLIGAPKIGATVAIQHQDLTWFAELSPSHQVFNLRSKLRNLARSKPAEGWLSQLIDYQPQLVRVLWTLLLTAAIVTLTWIDGLPQDAFDWVRVIFLVLVWTGILVGASPGDDRLALRKNTIVFYDMFFDHVVPAERVSFAVANDELVGIRTTDPDDIYFFGPQGLLNRTDATTDQALSVLHAWQAEARPARGGRRLSVPFLGAIIIAVSTASAVVVALVG